MSIRASLGWVFAAAVASWLSVYDRPARDSADVVQRPAGPEAKPVALPQPAAQPRAAPPPPATPRRAVVTAVPAPPVQAARAPYEPTSTVEEPRVQAERDMFNAARELAVTKVKLRMETEPVDEARTDELQRQYNARFDGQRFGVRPEIRCVESVCKVRVESADAVALAEVERIHGDLGFTPLTTVEGDPAEGIIRSVSYYVMSDDVSKELVGSDTRGILTPGP